MATGEQALFVTKWEALEPEERVSFITGHCLADQHQMMTFYFAHVLGKGNYPKFRLNPKNIVLLNFHEHKLWDTARFKIEENPHLREMWDKMYKLEEELIEEYYGNDTR